MTHTGTWVNVSTGLPRGPASETLYKILQVLYSEKEAKWVALLPVRPFTIKKAAKIWGDFGV